MKVFSIKKNFKKAAHWLLFLVSLLMIVSGYGISEFRIMEGLTFGLLSKSAAFTMHGMLVLPFVILLLLHVYLTVKKK
jgi:hypothetical protein